MMRPKGTPRSHSIIRTTRVLLFLDSTSLLIGRTMPRATSNHRPSSSVMRQVHGLSEGHPPVNHQPPITNAMNAPNTLKIRAPMPTFLSGQ
jgi:hypothetical protein